jgi:hypothetical protein
MKTLQGFRNRNFAAFFALAATGALLAPACGGDDNPAPSTPVISGGSGGSGGTSGGGSSAEGGGDNEGGGANEGGDTGSGGSRAGTGGRAGNGGTGGGTSGSSNNEGGDGGQDEIDCSVRGPDDCYRCDPVALDPAPEFPRSENEQFLNHCDDSQGSRFDNYDRIPGFNGTLPETLP